MIVKCGNVLAVFDLGCVKLEKILHLFEFLTHEDFRDWEKELLLMLRYDPPFLNESPVCLDC